MSVDTVGNVEEFAGALEEIVAPFLSVLVWLLATAIALVYIGFWMNVVRIHVVQGNIVGAIGTFVIVTGILLGFARSVYRE